MYSKTRVNKAGDNVRSGDANEEDFLVIENWRAAHNKILNDWQSNLRGRSKGKDIFFAQRLKRRATIFDKLSREPGMQLARMHDIAGCRLIFNDLVQMNEFRDKLHGSPWIKHILRKAGEVPYPYDYIEHSHPDNSGYRGIHDIYRYKARSGRSNAWDDLQVEIQYRTKVQNSWATANEIAGSLTGSRSKFGQGDERQKEFFRLASEIIARSAEQRKSCYPNLTNRELYDQFLLIDDEIKLLRRLKNLQIASVHYDYRKQNIILVYNENKRELTINAYKSLPEAQKQYFILENEKKEYNDIVLVRAPTEEGLKQAYKNYFSDTEDFTRLIRSGLAKMK